MTDPMNKNLTFSSLILLLSVILFLSGCQKKPVIPTVDTTAVSSMTTSAVTTGGEVKDDGGDAIIARGVCWSIKENPTIIEYKTSNGTGVGSFISNISGLLPGQTYYIKAYATNKAGTAYGSQITVTMQAEVPTITTSPLSAITTTSANCGGNVTNDGGSPVASRGICWSTSQNPTNTLSTMTTDGSGKGSFTSSITGLLPGVAYYVRAYATNRIGTAYGNQLTLTTLAILPTVTTASASTVATTTAVIGGNISSDGGASISARGVCWSTNFEPTISLTTKTADGVGSGNFSSNLTGLTPNTTYYVRAYATNNVGTSYGNEVIIKTQVGGIIFNPSLTYGSVSDIEGNMYRTISIGSQVWMAENLKTTKYNDGTAIPLFQDNAVWTKLTSPAYCWFENDASTYKNTYGALYNWFTVGIGKLCPIGWHVPTDSDWTALSAKLGGVTNAGTKLKETGKTHWSAGNDNATNASGFTAVPGGERYAEVGAFGDMRNFGYWWTSSEYNANNAMMRFLNSGDGNLYKYVGNKKEGYSVRCIMD
jgi:uncharacterized protein (TIGR02145 family)